MTILQNPKNTLLIAYIIQDHKKLPQRTLTTCYKIFYDVTMFVLKKNLSYLSKLDKKKK
ncbi:MAG: hypothetical protein GY936_04835 [Ignavibacteriae bacterium]|nr:hypothetical protein [Ignavibacteriota bacterium]